MTLVIFVFQDIVFKLFFNERETGFILKVQTLNISSKLKILLIFA
ncbi:hypothetical protein VIBNISFn118_610026 [Vibrio nigripulchritudo SFn118]|nr:hypothetical protein VIBNISFn118_610026 [Vibrio nigripulchritudo SFn118]